MLQLNDFWKEFMPSQIAITCACADDRPYIVMHIQSQSQSQRFYCSCQKSIEFGAFSPIFLFSYFFLRRFYLYTLNYKKGSKILKINQRAAFAIYPQSLTEIYIKIRMIQFCSLPSYISLSKNLSGSKSRYEHQRTNSSIGSNRCLVGSWKGLLYLYLFPIWKKRYANFGQNGTEIWEIIERGRHLYIFLKKKNLCPSVCPRSLCALENFLFESCIQGIEIPKILTRSLEDLRR